MSNDFSRGTDASPADAGALPARLPLSSADPLAPRYEHLKALFPMAVTNGRVDIEKLRAVMGEQAAAGPERYGLSWAGKSDALKALRHLTTATLLPAPSESVNWDTTGHAIIEGDNLEVLKVLQHAYHGKVKLICMMDEIFLEENFIEVIRSDKSHSHWVTTLQSARSMV